ncbi:hypothetical protein [Roseibium album]|uniref:hypothetical protein n=1 Tax=Roseibium album TaxID=311410 RepID=UPI003299224A
MSNSESSSDFMKMQGDKLPEEGKTEVDISKYELPLWSKVLGCGLIFAAILAISLMTHASYTPKVTAPNLTNLIVILASLGLLLTVPWHRLPITGVKIAGMELVFDVLSERTNELAELRQRIAVVEHSLGVSSEEEDNEKEKGAVTEYSETNIKQSLNDRKFRNIKSIQIKLNLPTTTKREQRKLRRVLERMVVKEELEMKLSTHTGNRLYRLMSS